MPSDDTLDGTGGLGKGLKAKNIMILNSYDSHEDDSFTTEMLIKYNDNRFLRRICTACSFYASFPYGESAIVASEYATLGTHAVFYGRGHAD